MQCKGEWLDEGTEGQTVTVLKYTQYKMQYSHCIMETLELLAVAKKWDKMQMMSKNKLEKHFACVCLIGSSISNPHPLVHILHLFLLLHNSKVLKMIYFKTSIP